MHAKKVEQNKAGSKKQKNSPGNNKYLTAVGGKNSSGSKQEGKFEPKSAKTSEPVHAEINPSFNPSLPSGSTAAHPSHFAMDVQELRKSARGDIESGAVTPDYKASRDAVVEMLNHALATELVCTLRYRKHYFMAKGIESDPVAQEFLEHSNQELQHADKIAERIVQLGGEPDLNPAHLLESSHAEYVDTDDLKKMISENLVAERIAIESYRRMIEFVAPTDPTTRRLLEEVLAVEEEHAEDLSTLLSKR
jgi:bacterioferritin